LLATSTKTAVLDLVRQLNADGLRRHRASAAAGSLGKRVEQEFDTIDPPGTLTVSIRPTSKSWRRAGDPRHAPSGVIELLVRGQIPMAGKRAVIIGRNDIVGRWRCCCCTAIPR
jgi:hypothetical protein